MTKVFGPFFRLPTTVTNITKQFIKDHTLFWQLHCNLSQHFLGLKRLLKTQSIQKKAIFPVKKSFPPFLYRFIEHEKAMQHFIRVQQIFWQVLRKW